MTDFWNFFQICANLCLIFHSDSHINHVIICIYVFKVKLNFLWLMKLFGKTNCVFSVFLTLGVQNFSVFPRTVFTGPPTLPAMPQQCKPTTITDHRSRNNAGDFNAICCVHVFNKFELLALTCSSLWDIRQLLEPSVLIHHIKPRTWQMMAWGNRSVLNHLKWPFKCHSSCVTF